MSVTQDFRSCVASCAVGTTLLISGCASEFAKVAPQPPEKYERLGPASGTGCGTLFIDGTAWNFIPVLLNSRVERAYANALESVPGATALVDVTISEDWFWWVLGSTKCVTVSGEAIR
jgi:hypothetical protein